MSGVDKRIFGEPSETGTTGSVSVKTTSDDRGTGGNVGPVVALRLGKYFAIQSGVNFNIDFKGPSKLQYTYAQVPALLRADWSLYLDGMGFNIGFGLFGGTAFNFPIRASGDAQSATMAIPMSGIVGIEMRTGILYMDIQYTFDFGETTVKLADGHEGTFNRSSVDLVWGLKFYMPFRR
jgi:hypothetical protein